MVCSMYTYIYIVGICILFFLKVRGELEAKMKQRFIVYDALLYRSQVVAGMNYIIKVSLWQMYF